MLQQSWECIYTGALAETSNAVMKQLSPPSLLLYTWSHISLQLQSTCTDSFWEETKLEDMFQEHA